MSISTMHMSVLCTAAVMISGSYAVCFMLTTCIHLVSSFEGSHVYCISEP